MKICVIGAETRLGAALRRHLELSQEVVTPQEGDLDLQGARAVIHCSWFEPEPAGNLSELLEQAGLRSYRVGEACREQGVERIVQIGSLRIFDACPEHYLIDEMWEPRPRPVPEQLVPFISEQCVREFVREGPLCGIALRFLPIGDDPERQTRLSDALHAVDRALALDFEPGGYRWHVFHIANSPRFLMRDGIQQLGFTPATERSAG